MASTPEGKVKAKVKAAFKYLMHEGYGLFYHMPVQNGMGAPILDFVGCKLQTITPEMVGKTVGLYFAVETKAPGGKATERQLQTMADIQKAGGATFVYDGRNTAEFADWLSKLYK